MITKHISRLRYGGTALEAAQFHAATFLDSAASAVLRAPADFSRGKQCGVLTVEFTVLGIAAIESAWRGGSS